MALPASAPSALLAAQTCTVSSVPWLVTAKWRARPLKLVGVAAPRPLVQRVGKFGLGASRAVNAANRGLSRKGSQIGFNRKSP